MWPTLQRGDRVAVDHTVGFKDLKRGDMIVFAVNADSSKPVRPGSHDDDKLLVKRIVALSGEAIEAHEGRIAIDDELLPEPYLLGRYGATDVPIEVLPKQTVWVLGDNRDESVDSRRYGAIPEWAIVGRVSYRWWPVNRFNNFT
jgi:signal peptidase I